MIPAIAPRPDHHLRIGLDGAIVAKAWLFREVVSRRCVNILHSLVSIAECEALRQFHEGLQSAVAHVEPSMLAAARRALTPIETALVIECFGSEDVASNIDHAGALDGTTRLDAEIVVVLPAPSTLVLFEYLSREVDDRDGRNLLASFVSPSEYWALMGTQCRLEPGAFYAIDRDYPVQVKEAREWLCSSGSGDLSSIAALGNEDDWATVARLSDVRPVGRTMDVQTFDSPCIVHSGDRFRPSGRCGSGNPALSGHPVSDSLTKAFPDLSRAASTAFGPGGGHPPGDSDSIIRNRQREPATEGDDGA